MRDHLGWVLALAITFFALALRIDGIDDFWLNADEGIYWAIAHHDLAQAHGMVVTNAHPPLYYYLLRAMTWFGDGIVPLRLPSALFGSLAVFAVYLVGRELQGRIGGLVAAVLLAVSPGALRLSNVARPYMAQLALCLLALWFVARVLQRRDNPGRDAAGFAGCALLALLVQYSTLLFVAALGLTLTLLWAFRQLSRTQVISLIAAHLLLSVAAGLLYVFHIGPHMMGSPMQANAQSWLRDQFVADLDGFGRNLRGLHGYFAGAGHAGASLVASAISWLLCLRGRAALIGILGPLLLVIAGVFAGLDLYPFGGSRHSTYLAAVLLPTIGCGFGRLLANRWTAAIGVALLGCLAAFRADLNTAFGGARSDPPGIRETWVPTPEVDLLVAALHRLGAQPGLLAMDAATASALAPVFAADRKPMPEVQARGCSCFRWRERIVVVARQWVLAAGFFDRDQPRHLGHFLERVGAAPELAAARDIELLMVTAGDVENGGGRQSGQIQTLPLPRGVATAAIASVHQTPNFHVFRLHPEVYAAMLAALPR